MEVQQPRGILSEEFPIEFQRPQIVQSGSVKQLKQKFDKKPPPPPKGMKAKKTTTPPGGVTSPMPVPAGGYPAVPSIEPPTHYGPAAPRSIPGARAGPPPFQPVTRPVHTKARSKARPKALPSPSIEPASGVMQLDIPTSIGAPSNSALAEAAKKRMLEIAERAQQHTTRKQNFERRSEMEKKKRRGGAPGDVVPLGKRKQPESDAPRSILRKPLGPEPPRARQRIYSPRTQVFNMDQPIAVH